MARWPLRDGGAGRRAHAVDRRRGGRLLGALRDERAEDDTLFIALADHQRIGKGTFYGVRTPMVLQWPARGAPALTLPASTLVTSLDIAHRPRRRRYRRRRRITPGSTAAACSRCSPAAAAAARRAASGAASSSRRRVSEAPQRLADCGDALPVEYDDLDGCGAGARRRTSTAGTSGCGAAAEPRAPPCARVSARGLDGCGGAAERL